MKKKAVAAALSVAVLLTGCTSVPDLTSADQNMEAEYMAGALLKYDKNYEYSLDYDRSVLDATPTPEPTPSAAPAATPGVTGQQGSDGASQGPEQAEPQSVSLDQLLGKKDIQVRVQACNLKKTYGTSYAKVTAQKGNRLLVVHFNIKNTGKAARKVDLSGNGVRYTLNIGGEAVASPLLSIVDDLQYFKQKIGGGESRQAVLIFEIKQSRSVKDAELFASREGYSSKISLD